MDMNCIITGILWMFAKLSGRWRGFMAGRSGRASGIRCTKRMPPISSTLQQATWERQIQDHYLRNKYGIPAMMAGADA